MAKTAKENPAQKGEDNDSKKHTLRLPFYSLAVPLQMKAKIYSTSSSQRRFSFMSQCCSKGRELHDGEVSENKGQFFCDVREGWRCPDLPQAFSVWQLGKERERYDSAIKAVSAISWKRPSGGYYTSTARNSSEQENYMY